MREYQSLAHVRWECKFHIVWVPKYRRKKLYGGVRRRLGEIINDLCRQKGVNLIEGHAMSDHVHLCLSFPPKYSIAHVVGFLKGKSAIRLNREYSSKMKGGNSLVVSCGVINMGGWPRRKLGAMCRDCGLKPQRS